MKVIKIGGGCLKDGPAAKAIIDLITRRGKGDVFVLSAFYGVTDILISGIDQALAAEDNIPNIISRLKGLHHTIIKDLIDEFNLCETKEARLAKDADQISFILELKKTEDIGAKGPEKWLPHVLKRLKTDIGKQIAQSIMETGWDEWWVNDYSE